MIERAYTLKEIAALRSACEGLWLYGPNWFKGGSSGVSRSYMANEMSVAVEEMVRTYMTAGKTSEDFYKEYA